MTPVSKSIASSGLLKPINGTLRNVLVLVCTRHHIYPGPSSRTQKHPESPASSDSSEPETEEEHLPKRSKPVIRAYLSCLND